MLIRSKRLWFLGICFLVLLILLLVLFFTQNREDLEPLGEIEKVNSFVLSSEDLSDLLQRELADHLPFQDLDASISSDGTVMLSASVRKADLIRLLEDRQSAVRFAASLLPDPIDAQLVFGVHFDDGRLIFTPSRLSVAQFDLTSFLTSELSDAANGAIARFFEEKEIEILSFEVLPDAFSMNIKQDLA